MRPESLQIGERIVSLDGQFLRPAESTMSGSVYPHGGDTGLTEEREELAAPATDVEHGCGVGEIGDVASLTVANVCSRAAHARFEGEVVERAGH